MTGKVTELGRYLDTLLDLVVTVALFTALARHGPAVLALLAWLALTLMLSLDHVFEERYRRLRSPLEPSAEPGAPRFVISLLRGVYAVLLGTQDRAIEALDRATFRRIAGVPEEGAALDARLAWSDLFSTASLVNLGMSTQLAALGVCAVMGAPFAYVWLVFAQLAYVAAMQAVRVARFRSYLRAARGNA